MSPEVTARLAGFGISVAAESSTVSIFVREGCVAMAGRTAEGGFSVGSTAILTESGLAYLVWRESEPRLVAKGSEIPANAAQVEMIRKFSEDLKAALEAAVDPSCTQPRAQGDPK